jgi:hypothetical protein
VRHSTTLGSRSGTDELWPSQQYLLGLEQHESGTIHAFNPTTGQFVGTVRGRIGIPIVIDQLWGIDFGCGTSNDGATNDLFFTAGPFGDVAGTFGLIRLRY